MAFNIPVHGEELIELDWNNELRVNGKFYGRLLNQTRQMKNGVDQRKLLNKFLHFLVKIGQLTEIKVEDVKCNKNACQAFDTEWAWSQKDSIFVVTQKLNDRLQFVARGHETGDSHFGKISFAVENADNSEVSRTDLALSLFASSCDR